MGGDVQCRYPSRFLLEMNMDDLDVVRGFSPEWFRAAKEHIAETDRNRELGEGLDLEGRSGVDGVAGKKVPSAQFQEGDRVLHKVMGAGTVVGVDTENFYYEVKFDKIPTHRAIQFDYPLVSEH